MAARSLLVKSLERRGPSTSKCQADVRPAKMAEKKHSGPVNSTVEGIHSLVCVTRDLGLGLLSMATGGPQPQHHTKHTQTLLTSANLKNLRIT